jgi:hypothetical protein
MYKLIKDSFGNLIFDVIKREDGAFIPFSLGNTDYQAYLAWLALGNTPLPADEVNHGTN